MDIVADVRMVSAVGRPLGLVVGTRFVVCPDLAVFAKTYHLNSAQALVGFSQSFPSELAQFLGWTVEQTQQAVAAMELDMVGAGAMLPFSEPRRFAMGLDRAADARDSEEPAAGGKSATAAGSLSSTGVADSADSADGASA